MKTIYHMGLDIGSTTVKLVIINNNGKIIYNRYERHFSDIKKTIIRLIKSAYENFRNENIPVIFLSTSSLEKNLILLLHQDL